MSATAIKEEAKPNQKISFFKRKGFLGSAFRSAVYGAVGVGLSHLFMNDVGPVATVAWPTMTAMNLYIIVHAVRETRMGVYESYKKSGDLNRWGPEGGYAVDNAMANGSDSMVFQGLLGCGILNAIFLGSGYVLGGSKGMLAMALAYSTCIIAATAYDLAIQFNEGKSHYSPTKVSSGIVLGTALSLALSFSVSDATVEDVKNTDWCGPVANSEMVRAHAPKISGMVCKPVEARKPVEDGTRTTSDKGEKIYQSRTLKVYIQFADKETASVAQKEKDAPVKRIPPMQKVQADFLDIAGYKQNILYAEQQGEKPWLPERLSRCDAEQRGDRILLDYYETQTVNWEIALERSKKYNHGWIKANAEFPALNVDFSSTGKPKVYTNSYEPVTLPPELLDKLVKLSTVPDEVCVSVKTEGFKADAPSIP